MQLRNSAPEYACRGGAGSPSASLAWFLLGFLLCYTAWAWAGLRPSLHRVGVAASVVLLASLFKACRTAGRRLWLDPVFFLGLAFLGLLALQWANAGREQYFDVGYERWMYTAPRWPGWPSAFARPEALQMLTWFFPAWGVALAIRARIWSARALWKMLMLMACNAGLLAIFGLIQFASGTQSIYWTHPLNGHFFASFAYGNHTAPFFVLASALAAGLMYREIFDSRWLRPDGGSAARLRHPLRVAVLVPVLLLCLAGANLGLSRTGVILAGVLAVFVAGYGWVRGWHSLTASARVNLVALLLGAGGVVYFVVAGMGEGSIRKEFTLKATVPGEVNSLQDRINIELGRRPLLVRAAIRIWREHPWVGVGGWGYKYLLAEQVPESHWGFLASKGWANVHFDFLQFLAEFGVVGCVFLLGALGVMARDLFRRSVPRNALWVMGLAGLGLVLVFSAIDLPFRSPAILYTWVAILAALPAASGPGTERASCRTPPGLATTSNGHQGILAERTSI